MNLKGSFFPPGDKSVSHRMVLFSLLAGGSCTLTNLADGQDVLSSCKAVADLGVGVTTSQGEVHLHGLGGRFKERARIDCGNSGTSMRLLMGILAGREGEYILFGDESLNRRPMERVAEPLRRMGAQVTCTDGHAPVTIRGGGLKGIEFHSPVASAQLKSAVLLAGLKAEGVTTVIEPAPSRDHTERLLESMGARIERGENRCRVQASELTMPARAYVPGDPSSAAFFLCAAAFFPQSRVTAKNVLLSPTRIGFLMVLKRMGAEIRIEMKDQKPEPFGDVTVTYSPHLAGTEIPADEVPSLVDEVPILALTGTQCQGTTLFREVGELRLKETDRLSALTENLAPMGADLAINGNDLAVNGPTPLVSPDHLDACGDHRLAMTLRLATLLAGSDTPITGEESVGISYPGFHGVLETLTR